MDYSTELSQSVCCDATATYSGDGVWTCDNCHGPAYEATGTEYSVLVTLESGMPTEPRTFTEPLAADMARDMVLAILTGSTEPVASHADHYPRGTVYTSNGTSDVFGAWSVYLTAKDV